MCHLLSTLTSLLYCGTMSRASLHHCRYALYSSTPWGLFSFYMTTEGTHVPCLSFIPIKWQSVILATQLDLKPEIYKMKDFF